MQYSKSSSCDGCYRSNQPNEHQLTVNIQDENEGNQVLGRFSGRKDPPNKGNKSGVGGNRQHFLAMAIRFYNFALRSTDTIQCTMQQSGVENENVARTTLPTDASTCLELLEHDGEIALSKIEEKRHRHCFSHDSFVHIVRCFVFFLLRVPVGGTLPLAGIVEHGI